MRIEEVLRVGPNDPRDADDDPRAGGPHQDGNDGRQEFPPALAHEPPPPDAGSPPEPPNPWEAPDQMSSDPDYRPRHRADGETGHRPPYSAPPSEGQDSVRRPPYGGRWDRLVASRVEDVPEADPGTAAAEPPAVPDESEQTEEKPVATPAASTPDNVEQTEPGPNERSGLWGRSRELPERPAKPTPAGKAESANGRATGTIARREPRRTHPAPEPAKPRMLVAFMVMVTILVVGGGAAIGVYLWLSPAAPESVRLKLDAGESLVGNQVFAAAPGAAGDGSYQRLEDVASDGSRMIAVGTDLTSTPPRPLFLVSSDGGAKWSLAKVSGGGGGSVTPVRQVAGGEKGWLSANIHPGSTHRMWTSTDGSSWEPVDGAELKAFGRQARVADLARTASGYVAVGVDGPGGTPMAWTSADGTAWKRRPLGKAPASMLGVAVRGNVAVAVAKGAGDRAAVFRSADGGGSWRPGGAVSARRPGAVAANKDGFVIGAETGNRVGAHCSRDGAEWARCGSIAVTDAHGGLRGLAGWSGGYAAVVETTWERPSVFISEDGRAWRQSGREVGALTNGNVRGIAAGEDDAVVVAGDVQSSGVDNQPFLWSAGRGRIDPGDVANLRRPQRRTVALAAHEGLLATVGSAQGDAAIWTTGDGKTWAHGVQQDGALGGKGRQELTGVAHGERGWLAAGTSTDKGGVRWPLVVASADGKTWRKVPLKGLALADGDVGAGPVVAAGAAGSVIAGERAEGAPVLWHSRDNKAFARARIPAAKGVRLRDVTATADGFAAVGGTGAGTKETAAVWLTTDGRTWTETAAVPDAPEGGSGAGLRHVVAKGSRLVATGTTVRNGVAVPFAAVSDDGGESWETDWIKSGQPSEVKDVLVTPRGFIAVGIYGPAESSDIGVWLSDNGLLWERQPVEGQNLGGAGAQWLQAVAQLGDRVIAVGRGVTNTDDRLTIWRTAIR